MADDSARTAKATRPSILSAEDVAAMRSEFFVSLDAWTDQQLVDALAGHEHIIYKAREWGWGDTEVRDATGEVLGIED